MKLFALIACLGLLGAVGCRQPAPPFMGYSKPPEPPFLAQLKTQCALVWPHESMRGGEMRLTGLFLHNASEPAFRTLTNAQGIEELFVVATDLLTPAFAELGKLTSLKSLRAINGQLLPEQLAGIQTLTNLENLDLHLMLHESTESRAKLLGDLSSEEKHTWDMLKRKGVDEDVIQQALLTDRAMPYLSKLTKLRTLNLYGAFISAEGLKHLGALTNLEVANLGPMGLTGETAAPFQTMTKLRSLQYFNADDGIVDTLSKNTNLEYLDIWSGEVTDAGASRLANLKKMQHLEIRGNKMTDQGLQQLSQLPELKRLDLSYAKHITTNGIDQLLKLRPDIEITYRKTDL